MSKKKNKDIFDVPYEDNWDDVSLEDQLEAADYFYDEYENPTILDISKHKIKEEIDEEIGIGSSVIDDIAKTYADHPSNIPSKPKVEIPQEARDSNPFKKKKSDVAKAKELKNVKDMNATHPSLYDYHINKQKPVSQDNKETKESNDYPKVGVYTMRYDKKEMTASIFRGNDVDSVWSIFSMVDENIDSDIFTNEEIVDFIKKAYLSIVLSRTPNAIYTKEEFADVINRYKDMSFILDPKFKIVFATSKTFGDYILGYWINEYSFIKTFGNFISNDGTDKDKLLKSFVSLANTFFDNGTDFRARVIDSEDYYELYGKESDSDLSFLDSVHARYINGSASSFNQRFEHSLEDILDVKTPEKEGETIFKVVDMDEIRNDFIHMIIKLQSSDSDEDGAYEFNDDSDEVDEDDINNEISKDLNKVLSSIKEDYENNKPETSDDDTDDESELVSPDNVFLIDNSVKPYVEPFYKEDGSDEVDPDNIDIEGVEASEAVKVTTSTRTTDSGIQVLGTQNDISDVMVSVVKKKVEE